MSRNRLTSLSNACVKAATRVIEGLLLVKYGIEESKGTRDSGKIDIYDDE